MLDNFTEKQWILLAHLGTLVGFIFPFGNIIVPLFIYSTKKESLLIREHSRNSLNFQISISIYILVSLILILFVIGFFLITLCVVLQLVFVLVAAVNAEKNEIYQYPLTIQFIKD